jgi:hypothetical protein
MPGFFTGDYGRPGTLIAMASFLTTPWYGILTGMSTPLLSLSEKLLALGLMHLKASFCATYRFGGQ